MGFSKGNHSDSLWKYNEIIDFHDFQPFSTIFDLKINLSLRLGGAERKTFFLEIVNIPILSRETLRNSIFVTVFEKSKIWLFLTLMYFYQGWADPVLQTSTLHKTFHLWKRGKYCKQKRSKTYGHTGHKIVRAVSTKCSTHWSNIAHYPHSGKSNIAQYPRSIQCDLI